MWRRSLQRWKNNSHKPLWLVIFSISAGLATSKVAHSQAPPHHEERPEWKAFYASQKLYQDRGTEALTAEATLEKKDKCKDAVTTLDISECESRLFDSTKRNYLAYVRAIGALLRLAEPGAVSEKDLPPNAGAAFDATEALWIKYRDSECESGGNIYWGGTMRPVAILGCEVMLTQQHIHDLQKIYTDLWS